MLWALAGCGGAAIDPPSLPRLPPPSLPQGQGPEPDPDTPASAAERTYYTRTQETLLDSGLLRTDGGGADAPFDAQDVTRHFLRLAFYDEYDPAQGNVVQQETPTVLGRWTGPVRIGVEFGPSVPQSSQATERARIASYASRLTDLTGHPISVNDRQANFVIFIGSIDERRDLAPLIEATLPGISPSLIDGMTRMGRANFCLVYVNSDDTGAVKERALAVIPSELPDLMRLMCLQEEIAQGLGLGNDSRAARPSIFNDDNEFATVTPMDEILLRMLYAPDLAPGMTELQARPIVESLARRLMGGET